MPCLVIFPRQGVGICTSGTCIQTVHLKEPGLLEESVEHKSLQCSPRAFRGFASQNVQVVRV